MAYHAKKEGLEAFKKRKTKTGIKCFCCGEMIPAGSYRYTTGMTLVALCTSCYNTWEKEGGKLGDISRAIK